MPLCQEAARGRLQEVGVLMAVEECFERSHRDR